METMYMYMYMYKLGIKEVKSSSKITKNTSNKFRYSMIRNNGTKIFLN